VVRFRVPRQLFEGDDARLQLRGETALRMGAVGFDAGLTRRIARRTLGGQSPE
jgi:hypothetical protein